MTQNVKVKIAIGLLVIMAAAAGYFFFTYRSSLVALEQQNNEDQARQNDIVIEDKKITDQTKPFSIDITYPTIKGHDDFNQKIDSIFDEDLAIFKKNAMENDQAVKETDPEGYAAYPREYDFKVSYEKGEVNAEIASFIFSVYTFTGGAHGSGYFFSFNYNLKENREIALAELFPNQSDYLKKISDYTSKELTRQVIERAGNTEGSWIGEGTSPKTENFSAFLINGDSITFYFSPYQIAPYVLGDFKVTMPR